jgi:hypothetical protein
MYRKPFPAWHRWLLGILLCSALDDSSAGTLTGAFAPIAAGSNVNLTLNGKHDWVHWGLYTEASINRKNCAALKIGMLRPFSDTNNPLGFVQQYQFSDHASGFTWFDGIPTGAQTNTTTGVWAYGVPTVGTGFEFSVPADATLRTLQVFVGVFSGRGSMQVSLSDNSAPIYSDTSLANLFGNGPGGVYTLNYAANSPGQTLTVRWTLAQAAGQNTASANVTIQAATLSAPAANNPPLATLTSPTQNASFPEPANLMLTADAVDFDGSVTNVAFYANNTLLGQLATAPFSVAWNNVLRGKYTLTAIATDNLGQNSCAVPVDVFVYGGTGGQTNTVEVSPPAVDLTAEGLADWAHWGLVTNTSFNRKALVQPKISNFTPIGDALINRYENNYTAFTWSDGLPTPDVSGVTSGVFITGTGNGFELAAPAGVTPRQLRVYVGGYGFHGEFRAWLSDLSAPPYIDTSVSNVFGNSYVVHTINYTAATPGQQLHVTYRAVSLFDQIYGNVTLQAATLQGGPAEPVPVQILNPHRQGDDFVLSFDSALNWNYTIQYSDTLPALNWTDLTVRPGTGGPITVTNFNVPPGQRYYRVQTE